MSHRRLFDCDIELSDEEECRGQSFRNNDNHHVRIEAEQRIVTPKSRIICRDDLIFDTPSPLKHDDLYPPETSTPTSRYSQPNGHTQADLKRTISNVYSLM